MRFFLLLSVFVGTTLAVPLLAQTPTPEASPIPAADYSEEGLDDADVDDAAIAETVPTDGIKYRWERLTFGLRRAFVFNAEKKAELDRAFLHRLDRKLTACAELGDEDCMARVKAHMAQAHERAEKHLEKRTELREQHLERFQAWRERREARIEDLRERAHERQSQRQELREQRQENLPELRQQHQERIQERRERLHERQGQRREAFDELKANRPETLQQRQELREQSRSFINQRLDATVNKAERQREGTRRALEEVDRSRELKPIPIQ